MAALTSSITLVVISSLASMVGTKRFCRPATGSCNGAPAAGWYKSPAAAKDEMRWREAVRSTWLAVVMGAGRCGLVLPSFAAGVTDRGARAAADKAGTDEMSIMQILLVATERPGKGRRGQQ